MGLRLDHDLNPAVGVPLNHRLDPDQRLDVSVEPSNEIMIKGLLGLAAARQVDAFS